MKVKKVTNGTWQATAIAVNKITSSNPKIPSPKKDARPKQQSKMLDIPNWVALTGIVLFRSAILIFCEKHMR